MIIFFDIDGTLVDEKSQILPQSTADAVEALIRQGHTPIVNTGRPYTHIDPRVRALPFAGCVAAGGSEVRLGQRWLKKETAPAEAMDRLIRQVRANGVQVMYEAEGGYYLDGEYSAHPEIDIQCAFMRSMGNFVRDVREGITDPVVKFCTFDMPGCDRAAMVRDAAPWFEYIDRRGMAEFVLKGCSKSLGMEMILKELNCPKAQTMAFGDSANDVPMLKAAGIGVAMGNGVEEAKNAADFVTKTVLEDGIAYALKHFELI